MLYNKILVLVFFVCYLEYPICLGYMAFLTGGIYTQSLQSAQIEFSALNTINALHEICTSCHNACSISEKIVIIFYYFIYIFVILIS